MNSPTRRRRRLRRLTADRRGTLNRRSRPTVFLYEACIGSSHPNYPKYLEESGREVLREEDEA